MMEPSWRKPFGVLMMMIIITIWTIIIVSFSASIAQLPGFLQAIIYLFAGIAWIVPMKPLLQWMETGRFK